ncbi:class II fructose-bisphosphatase [Clostridium cylindrosporum]|uniref:Fructose-1,6-bisphosphatase n=1 Tax=Clostridium cylindrosporum DSM 605 TaxID=1121307 RepID=A0A0J8DAN2_CLOCY|nr:class II fructose-bisphosphatase [Clostridium cylindrosporum]KMT23095.1 fructose-1,6-bisphosphatase class 2 [Clostridium cylindrosporum DSM 605]
MKDYDIAMGIIRVTEAATLQCSKFLGRGNSETLDKVAVDGARHAFELLPIKGKVVIGECELEKLPIMYHGEKVGMWEDDQVKADVAIDPLDGASLVAKGRPNALSSIAVTERGGILSLPKIYMKKIAVGPRAKGSIDINLSLTENIKKVSKSLSKDITEMTLMIQDRDRHSSIIEEARGVGVRVKIFSEGDIAAALATAFEYTGVDMLIGIGGTPEGTLAAAALKCIGGELQAILTPQNDEEINMCKRAGIDDLNKIFTQDDLIKSDDVYFAATAITNCDVLKGVRYLEHKAITESLVMRSFNGTVRFVKATHNLDKSMLSLD